MDPHDLQARWQLHEILPEDVPAAARALLEAGFDTPSLRVLAGLTSPTSADLHPWIDRYFSEAGLPTITDDEARWRHVRGTAHGIVTGAITPREGATVLWHLCTDLGLPESLHRFVYLAADYGEGPEDSDTEAAWFDAEIIKGARELLATGQNGERDR